MSEIEEKPGAWWRKIYVIVVLFTVFVISMLGVFTWYFSQ